MFFAAHQSFGAGGSRFLFLCYNKGVFWRVRIALPAGRQGSSAVAARQNERLGKRFPSKERINKKGN